MTSYEMGLVRPMEARGAGTKLRTINAPLNPDVPVLVARSTITSVEDTGVRLFHNSLS